ncbi:VOC family protein [Kiloniella antarctica]|uniref:VOC family protein n=1 Tax=Kiloniella antarctica TaxID=1550907 RepID=A0ABW5BFU6_9PROT
MKSLFHFAYNVRDLTASRNFYGKILGCKEGRSTSTWVDYDFFGHEISLHIGEPFKTEITGQVGGNLVPMPHLGVILDYKDWLIVVERLKDAEISFVLEPSVRFEGEPGEQWTMFFYDPSGNPIEIKGFMNMDRVFAS